jgi:hypothetical protein
MQSNEKDCSCYGVSQECNSSSTSQQNVRHTSQLKCYRCIVICHKVHYGVHAAPTMLQKLELVKCAYVSLTLKKDRLNTFSELNTLAKRGGYSIMNTVGIEPTICANVIMILTTDE